MDDIEDLKNQVIDELMKAKAEREENRINTIALNNRTKAMQDMWGEKNIRLERQITAIELREHLLKKGEEELAKKSAEYNEKIAKLKSLLEIQL